MQTLYFNALKFVFEKEELPVFLICVTAQTLHRNSVKLTGVPEVPD